MPDSSPSDRITVREATPVDLPAVAALLSARDEQQRSVEQVGNYLWQLDPDCTRTWIALAGTKPVGITMLYLRDMAWPTGEDPGRILRAGYWAHLFVEPEFRKKMVYPQLVLAMIRGMKQAGLDIIYTGTRQSQVAEGHQKLGFALVGKLPVHLRPFRPFRLLAKHKGAAAVAPCMAPLDALYGVLSHARPSKHMTIEVVDLASSAVEAIVGMLNAQSNGVVHQKWTADLFRRRYIGTLDGEPYRVTMVCRDGAPVAAVVTTLAIRGNGIKAGVLLEIAAAPNATDNEVQSLLADAEQFAIARGAELMLALPSSIALPQLGKLANKYLATRSEKYHMLVYPKAMATGDVPAADLDAWRFSLGDHDAF